MGCLSCWDYSDKLESRACPQEEGFVLRMFSQGWFLENGVRIKDEWLRIVGFGYKVRFDSSLGKQIS